MTKHILILGDYTDPPYHPLTPITDILRTLLSDYTISFTEDRNHLLIENINKFDLIISYTDSWNSSLDKKQISGLLNYISGGGKLLVIHNGISLQSNFEFANIVGARFTGHPDYTNLKFSFVDSGEKSLYQFESFEMDEEPYQFVFANFTEKNIFMEYELNGVLYPAGWDVSYGMGKVVYLSPGHDLKTFENINFQNLLKYIVNNMINLTFIPI